MIFAIYILSSALGLAQSTGGSPIQQFDGEYPGDRFSESISPAGDVNGDGVPDLIVGAPKASPGGLSQAGSVFVYSGADGTEIHRWNGGSEFDRLGWSVAGGGDINGDSYGDLIASSSQVFSGLGSDPGTVFVFSGFDGSLLHQISGSGFDDRLGDALSGLGDINGDGFADFLASAPGTDHGGLSYSGTVFAFSGLDGSIIHQWNGSAIADGHSICVASAGDVDNDGVADVIAGFPNADPGGFSSAGSVFVFSGRDGTQMYRFDGAEESDFFGTSVSSAGDANADGHSDLIIGIPGGMGTWAFGTVLVYSGIDGSQLHDLEGGGTYWTTTSGRFGQSVSTLGDVNGDGFDDVVVGAPGSFAGGIHGGSVFAISGADGSHLRRWDGGQSFTQFGQAVSGLGDVEGDGVTEILVSAPENTPGGRHHAGSAYVFSLGQFLFSNTYTLSAAAGGDLDFELDFPSHAALLEYKILISSTGTGPTFFGVTIPLTRDLLLGETYNGFYHMPFHQGLQGTLDSDGDASGGMTFPPGVLSALTGSSFNLAAIANPPGQDPTHSSAAVVISITL